MEKENHYFYKSEISAVPESYRPLIFISFGIWGWITVLSILAWQQIDVNLLLYTTTTTTKIKPLFLFAIALSIFITCHIILLEHTLFKQHTNIINHIGPVVFCYLWTAVLAFLGPCSRECCKFLK
jgi:hypothetical protein